LPVSAFANIMAFTYLSSNQISKSYGARQRIIYETLGAKIIKMIDLIKENISWIKDLFTLIFVGTATLIGILTYKRARATILQPIRSEVIKKQSELLSKLLKRLQSEKIKFEAGLDYINIIRINILYNIINCGFVIKNQEEIKNELIANTEHWIYCGESNVLKDIEILGVFKTSKDHTPDKDSIETKYEKLQNGEFKIDKIFLTKLNNNFIEELTEYIKDPFIPIKIQIILIELVDNIVKNLTIELKKTLEEFILQFSKEYFNKGVAPVFDFLGVYNEFNHSRIRHKPTIMKLRKEVRKYLLIDEPW
jgi:hypothetical protein